MGVTPVRDAGGFLLALKEEVARGQYPAFFRVADAVKVEIDDRVVSFAKLVNASKRQVGKTGPEVITLSALRALVPLPASFAPSRRPARRLAALAKSPGSSATRTSGRLAIARTGRRSSRGKHCRSRH
ncbi:hypothetical protein ACF07L_20000 [Streptomyces anulatus]|uniref:hypothetical protein n=1 Tax=Streptomyces anulatus TaxID=1892 RepID=UPI0036F9C0C1